MIKWQRWVWTLAVYLGGWRPKSIGLVPGQLGTGELSQQLSYDDSTINIILAITIINNINVIIIIIIIIIIIQ